MLAAAAKSLQSCPTLCDPMYCSPPGSSVHGIFQARVLEWGAIACPTLCYTIDSSLPGSPIPGILQARTLEWAAISFSNAWKWKVKVKSLSHVRLFATPWTAAYQAPPSMGFSWQEYWSGVPVPSPQNAWDWVYKLLDFRAVIWYSTEYISPTSRSRAAPVISDTPVFLQKAYE